MNCIKCNRKMEKGFLSSPRHIMWSKNKHNFTCSVFEDDENIKILPMSLVKIKNIESYVCRDCKIVITKY